MTETQKATLTAIAKSMKENEARVKAYFIYTTAVEKGFIFNGHDNKKMSLEGLGIALIKRADGEIYDVVLAHENIVHSLNVLMLKEDTVVLSTIATGVMPVRCSLDDYKEVYNSLDHYYPHEIVELLKLY